VISVSTDTDPLPQAGDPHLKLLIFIDPMEMLLLLLGEDCRLNPLTARQNATIIPARPGIGSRLTLFTHGPLDDPVTAERKSAAVRAVVVVVGVAIVTLFKARQ
jgi:hypothetical protein